jgi:hypothetical protein
MSQVAEPYVVVRVTERRSNGFSGAPAAYRATEHDALTVAAERRAATGAEYEVWTRPYSDVVRLGLPDTLEA